MDGIECVFDGYAFEVPGGYLHAEGEVEVDLLDRRVRQQLLENVLFVDGRGRGVDLPARLLRLLGNLELNALLFWNRQSASAPRKPVRSRKPHLAH